MRPIKFHLSCSFYGQCFALQPGDQMKAHINSGRDTGGSDDRAGIDPAHAVFEVDIGKHRAQIVDIFPMGNGRPVVYTLKAAAA
ncbi:MAG: hypothetical protein KDI62_16715 [Anaerolineae bacterium]|nr:hypothetical protein [Anaerolineae bacterium]MCB9108802.1 hypothetical protein [Anaerolineales bacterium]